MESNTTRFVVIGFSTPEPTGKDKTSLVFSSKKDKPGSLYDVLGHFASKGINLTRISSRPTKNALGEYLFFVDFEGHAQDAEIAKVLGEIEPSTSFFRVLGSYPRL